MKYIIYLFTLSCITHFASAQQKFPIPISYLNDWDSLFTPAENEHINYLLDSFDRATTNQIAIATMNTILPYSSIKEYGYELGKEWKVGRQDKDNGLIITICVPCRSMAINTGLGTEKTITDDMAQLLIQSYIPYLKAGQYYIGMKQLLYSIFELWKEE